MASLSIIEVKTDPSISSFLSSVDYQLYDSSRFNELSRIEATNFVKKKASWALIIGPALSASLEDPAGPQANPLPPASLRR
jgi:hypothetical protein